MKAKLVLIMGLLVGSAAAAGTGTTLTYECERGARIEATYLNVAEGSFAVLMAEGHQVAMKAETTGSGARYVSMAADSPYVWWTKDAAGELLVKMGGGDIPVLSECTEQR